MEEFRKMSEKTKKDKEENSGVMDQLGALGVGLFALFFILTIVAIGLVIKYFFWFVCGAILNGLLYLDYKLTKYLIDAYKNKNFKPLKWYLFIVGVVCLSILVGYYLSKLDFINDIWIAIST